MPKVIQQSTDESLRRSPRIAHSPHKITSYYDPLELSLSRLSRRDIRQGLWPRSDDDSDYDEPSPRKRRGTTPVITRINAGLRSNSQSSSKRRLFSSEEQDPEVITLSSDESVTHLSTLEEVMQTLHTELPEKLISRDEECDYIRRFILNGIKKGGESQSLYISGVPGTGKTASVLKLDMLLTKRQEVVYTVFNWASIAESRVNVIAISNTLDLPERTLTARVSSRLGENRLCFQPYDHNQISEIITYRISNCEAVGQDAIDFGARKVASVSGDVRKALELIRRAIAIALEECEEKGENIDNARLTFQHVHDAIKESTASIRMEMCMTMSQHEEALFRAAVSDLEKSALDEMIFYRLLDEYKSVCFNMGLQAMSSSAVYSMLLDMACWHFFVVTADPDGGEMNRKVKLGFSLPEALFCLRQMEKRRKNTTEL
ncbi:origin recognition complex subunit 1 [Ditylenchus destructor]|nr:origin recognition complex subunit 1 [Ditylenchus destructor]